MSFQEYLEETYPNAEEYNEHLNKIKNVLNSEEYNFTDENSIASIASCRDELVKPITKLIEKHYGEAFNLCGLAGFLFCGKTSLEAFYAHTPSAGTDKFIFFLYPHIGINDNGIGKCTRVGIEESLACGALCAFRNELINKNVSVQLDHLDIEQTVLKQRLTSIIPYGDVPDLVTLTGMAHDMIVDDLDKLINMTINKESEYEYCVFSGILIHGPDFSNYIQPIKSYYVSSENPQQKKTINLD
eukprot:TRINITY_DN8465_c2_g1_i1.p1 TRINITY_DN8465_c2_g1~~TRINITY_DN8465_c2_g1_i1.p1  ORF type:complete len:243 (-),score=60.85 TRINITY_DN8465_c2_g1_i1:150-878(-)